MSKKYQCTLSMFLMPCSFASNRTYAQVKAQEIYATTIFRTMLIFILISNVFCIFSLCGIGRFMKKHNPFVLTAEYHISVHTWYCSKEQLKGNKSAKQKKKPFTDLRTHGDLILGQVLRHVLADDLLA